MLRKFKKIDILSYFYSKFEKNLKFLKNLKLGGHYPKLVQTIKNDI